MVVLRAFWSPFRCVSAWPKNSSRVIVQLPACLAWAKPLFHIVLETKACLSIACILVVWLVGYLDPSICACARCSLFTRIKTTFCVKHSFLVAFIVVPDRVIIKCVSNTHPRPQHSSSILTYHLKTMSGYVFSRFQLQSLLKTKKQALL